MFVPFTKMTSPGIEVGILINPKYIVSVEPFTWKNDRYVRTNMTAIRVNLGLCSETLYICSDFEEVKKLLTKGK